MPEQNIRILYVDDETNNLESFKANFRRHYIIFTAASARYAKEILRNNEIHILITDQKMPETPGTQMLEEAIRQYPDQIRILLTAYSDNETILDAFQRGLIYKYVLKPYDPLQLKDIIDKAFELYSLNRLKEVLYKELLKTREDLLLLKEINERPEPLPPLN